MAVLSNRKRAGSARIREIVLLGALSVSPLASAPASADVYCEGYVTNALSYGNGDVMAFTLWRNDWIKLCNLNSTRNGISPSTCFAWFATISNAVTYNKPAGFYFLGDPGACALIATYDGTPVPLYVRLVK
jgi:hypothetical protein